MPNPDIFISHATTDDAKVSEIHDRLEAATKRSLWVDHKDIAPGAEWQVEIETHLKLCPDMLLKRQDSALSADLCV